MIKKVGGQISEESTKIFNVPQLAFSQNTHYFTCTCFSVSFLSFFVLSCVCSSILLFFNYCLWKFSPSIKLILTILKDHFVTDFPLYHSEAFMRVCSSWVEQWAPGVQQRVQDLVAGFSSTNSKRLYCLVYSICCKLSLVYYKIYMCQIHI